MSFDDLNRYSNESVDDPLPNGRPHTGAIDLDADIDLMHSLIAGNYGQAPSDDSELAELLEHLDGADDMAGEVEARLDGILGTLNDLLDKLELGNDDAPQPELEGDKPGLLLESQSKSPLSKGPESY